MLLLNCGADAIGREAYVHGESGDLFACSNMPIEKLEWDLGGGGTVNVEHPQFAQVQWGEPGHYTGRVRAVMASGAIESTFEYVVVPAVQGLAADPSTQEIRFGQPVKIKVMTSHPAAAIEWRGAEEGGPAESGSGADFSFIYQQAAGVATMEVRIGDGSGLWGPWQRANTPVTRILNVRYSFERPSIPSGVTGQTATASLNAEYQATKVEWFLGEGAERIGGSDVQPEIRFLKPGWHRAGAQSFEGDKPGLAYPTGYFVADAAPQQWTSVPVTSLSRSTGGSVATVLDGKPAVAGYVPDTASGGYQLVVAIAKTPVPKLPEDWHTTSLDSSAFEGSVLMAEHEGLLQILYPGKNSTTQWASATTALPAQPTDWTTQTIDSQNPIDFGFLNGRLVVVTVREGGYSSNSQLTIVIQRDRARPNDSSVINFPPLVPIVEEPYYGSHNDSEDGMYRQPSPRPRPDATAQLFVIDGHLLVPHLADSRLAVAVALNTHPERLEDFTQYLLPSEEGNHLIAGFVHQDRLILPVGHYRELDWYEATSALPLTAADWQISQSEMSGYDPFRFMEQELVDGSLVLLAMRHPAYPMLLRGTAESLSDPRSWKPTYLPGEYSGDTSELLETDAGLAILLGGSDGPVLLYPDVPIPQ